MKIKQLILFLFFIAFNNFLNAQSVSITSSASGAICVGTNITFTATVTSISSPTYQWVKNGATIPGANSSIYTTSTLSNNDQIQVFVNGGINNANIVSNGLILNLDASNPASYSGVGNKWYDLSGNNNHATLMNSPTYDAISGSIVTNGSNQYISVPQISTSITNVTMQAWVYVTVPSKGPFIKNGTAGGGYAIGIGSNAYDVTGSNVDMLVYGSPGWINTGQSYGTTGWKLVTMTFDGSSTAKAYVNGTLIGSFATTPNSTFTGGLNFGANIGDQSNFYNGKFAAAYFYNRALSLTEVQQNYNAFATKSTAYSSNSITVSITGTTPGITTIGDGCLFKTTLSTSSGLSSYVWYKDNVAITGATSNTFTPTTTGVYQVQVNNGTCTILSSSTTIFNCAVDAYGKSVATSNINSIISTEGGANFGTGRDISGKLYNTIGLTTTSGTIGSTTAILGGVISPTNVKNTSIGVVYSTDSYFGTYSSTSIQSNVAAGTYTVTITGLSGLTNYFAKSFIVNKAGTSYGPTISFATQEAPKTLGQFYGGGVIFYILRSLDGGYDPNVQHGLIVSLEDQSASIRWNNGTNTTTGATASGYAGSVGYLNVGAGITNTDAIIASQGASTSSAAGLARAYRGGGYSDWYLGSTYEMLKLSGSWDGQSYGSGFTLYLIAAPYYVPTSSFQWFYGAGGSYWTSTEISSTAAVRQNFGSASQYNSPKTDTYGVRAIRKF